MILEILTRDIQNWITDKQGRTLPETAEGKNDFYELLGMPNSIRMTFDRYEIRKEEIELSGEIEIVEYDTVGKRPLRTLRGNEKSLLEPLS